MDLLYQWTQIQFIIQRKIFSLQILKINRILSSGTLHDSGCHILYSDSDADRLIVETAIKLNDVSDCIVVGDDIDLVLLLTYFCSLKIERNKLLFKPELKQNAKKIPYCWDTSFVILNLPERVVSNILFAHAINGYDTTSHLHSIKKKLPLKLLSTSHTYLKAAAEFNDIDNSKDSIIKAGETVVTQLYKTGFQGSLNQLRIEQF